MSSRDRIISFFNEPYTGSRGIDGGVINGNWSPAIDIYETEISFVLKAELPGIARKDIVLEVKENTLILKGKRSFHCDIKEENYHRMERSYGAFLRSFNLPNNIKNEKVSASFEDGVLEISIPKESVDENNVIQVNVE